jgi:hypothetical protein
MAYYNPFVYNRDNSTASISLVNPNLMDYKSLYGSSVSFTSRLNFIETIDNSLKVLPNSENNLSVKYNLKFLLEDAGILGLLRNLEIAGGYKYVKFKDWSGLYSDMIGLAEDYSLNKTSHNYTALDIFLSSYIKAPIFNWKTSSYLNLQNYSTVYSSNKSYKKYDFVYIDPSVIPLAKNYTGNKIDNFWFAKNDISAGTAFSLSNWTKDFIYPIQLPYQITNKFEVMQLNYRNSFIQNIKTKNNAHLIKDYNIKFENIDTTQCRSMLFFLEKKCGYRRFIFRYPVESFANGFGSPIYNKYKVFICTKWNHVFKYDNCHDLDITITEEPNPNIFIDQNSNYFLL